jgi:hypothetical protein
MELEIKKRTVTRQLSEFDPSYLELSLEQVLAKVQGLINEYGKDATLSWQPLFYYSYDQTPSPKFFVEIQELESDDEFDQRCTDRAEANRVDLEHERAEFARLQRKFALK